jgi:hypothetical protein
MISCTIISTVGQFKDLSCQPALSIAEKISTTEWDGRSQAHQPVSCDEKEANDIPELGFERNARGTACPYKTFSKDGLATRSRTPAHHMHSAGAMLRFHDTSMLDCLALIMVTHSRMFGISFRQKLEVRSSSKSHASRDRVTIRERVSFFL